MSEARILKGVLTKLESKVTSLLGENETDTYIDDWGSILKTLPIAHRYWDAWEELVETDSSLYDDMMARDMAVGAANAAAQKACNWSTCAVGDICKLGLITDDLETLIGEKDINEPTSSSGARSGAAEDALRDVLRMHHSHVYEEALTLGSDFYQAVKFGNAKLAKKIYKKTEKILRPHRRAIRIAYAMRLEERGVAPDGWIASQDAREWLQSTSPAECREHDQAL